MEPQTVVTSGFGKINLRDLANGAIMAALGAMAGLVYPVLDSWIMGGKLDINFGLIWKAGIGAGLLHLIRKIVSPPVIVVTNPSQQLVQSVQSGDAKVEVKSTDNSELSNQKTSI